MKITLRETITVRRTINDCFAYLQDFSTIEQWDKGVFRAVKTTPGPVKAGTHYTVTLNSLGFKPEMSYTQLEVSPNKRLVLSGQGDKFSALDTIQFTQLNLQRTRITYTAQLDIDWLPRGSAALARPYFKRLGKTAVTGLKAALETQTAPRKPSFKTRLGDRLLLPAIVNFTQRGYLAMPNKGLSHRMDDKTVVLTGPTSGLGLAAACELARLGAELILLGRDPQRLKEATRTIMDFSGCAPEKLHCYQAELSSLKETARAAQRIAADHPRIDVLINNAGALPEQREETSEGYESALAINFLSPALLYQILSPCLGHNSRVINVLSGGLYLSALNLDDLQFQNEPYNGSKAYARAKRALLCYMQTWGRDVTHQLHAMHPGWADTPGVAKSLPGFHKKLEYRLRDARMGADTIVWLASCPELSPCDQLWFDRQPHTTDVLPGTRFTQAESRALLSWVNEQISPLISDVIEIQSKDEGSRKAAAI